MNESPAPTVSAMVTLGVPKNDLGFLFLKYKWQMVRASLWLIGSRSTNLQLVQHNFLADSKAGQPFLKEKRAEFANHDVEKVGAEPHAGLI